MKTKQNMNVESSRTRVILECSHVPSEIRKAMERVESCFVWINEAGTKKVIARQEEGERTFTAEGVGI